jgi:hypothetical protein
VKQIILKFGLISGGLLAAMMWATIPFSDHGDMGLVIGYTTMVLAFMLVFFGIKAYRDGPGGGSVSFGKAFRVGMSIVGIAIACYVASWQIMYRTVATDFADKYAETQLAKAKAAGMPEAELQKEAKKMAEFAELYKNPLVNIGFTILEPLPVGLLMTLVAAAMLRRQATPV